MSKREGGIANEIGLNTILEVSNISGLMNEHQWSPESNKNNHNYTPEKEDSKIQSHPYDLDIQKPVKLIDVY